MLARLVFARLRAVWPRRLARKGGLPELTYTHITVCADIYIYTRTCSTRDCVCVCGRMYLLVAMYMYHNYACMGMHM